MPTSFPSMDAINAIDDNSTDGHSEKGKLLETGLSEISAWITKTEEESKIDGESEDASADEEDAEAKTAKHKEKWEARKEKYKRYADKGKVDKLKRVLERQEGKVQKAKDKGKEEVYINYKEGKVKYTKTLIKLATLMKALKSAGLV